MSEPNFDADDLEWPAATMSHIEGLEVWDAGTGETVLELRFDEDGNVVDDG